MDRCCSSNSALEGRRLSQPKHAQISLNKMDKIRELLRALEELDLVEDGEIALQLHSQLGRRPCLRHVKAPAAAIQESHGQGEHRAEAETGFDDTRSADT